ncbi:MAG: formylglycine-generating enzyme family protein [Planctomycetota bacterium]
MIDLRWMIVTAWLACVGTGLLPAGAGEPNPTVAKNSLGMKLVRIPAGEYVRGFQASDRVENRFHRVHAHSNRQDFRWEKPAHRVVISRSLEIAISEVTVGQFRRFTEASRYVTEAEQRGGALGFFPEQGEGDYVERFRIDADVTWKSPGFPQSEQHPVVAVSWKDAQAFCRWLSATEQRVYRLPSEAEWEYACRAGGTDWYSWGTDPDAAYQHANVADGALESAYPNTTRYQRAVRPEAGSGDGSVFTSPVMSFTPNDWGLYDTSGNVWEWCQDRWTGGGYDLLFPGLRRYQKPDQTLQDPVSETKTDQHEYGDWRVIRGGAWTCAPAAVRCSIRTYAEASDATVYTGFRVVRELTAGGR